MIYTTCKYAPEELFAGFGEEVKRLDPNPASFSCSDGCAHPNLCGFAKAVIEEVNRLKISRLIITDCCDAMRKTCDVLESAGMDFLYFLPLPHKTGEPEIRMFAGQLKKLKDSYAAFSKKTFSVAEAVQACRASAVPQKTEEGKEYISLTGAHGGSMLLEQIKTACPELMVKDDTCSGNRHFSLPDTEEAFPDTEEEFFLWYAKLLLNGLVPCMRMLDIRKRLKEDDTGLKGIVYHTIKFCDYYSFEYTGLKNRTKAPLLKIETDTTPQSSGQLKTRIEAFAETMRTLKKKEDPGTAGKKPDTDEIRYAAGVDSGSTSTDVVIMDKSGHIAGSAIVPTGMSAAKGAEKALAAALEDAGLAKDSLDVIIATGYGRDALGFPSVTEITCHAKGARFLFGGAQTVIDIGGQDSKIIRIDEEGNVLNFIMNDKCAAGTGRFLEMQARALGLSMEEMSTRGNAWKNEVRISNMCTVFAESEVVSLVAKNTDIADIIHGLNVSVAEKTVSLIRRGKGEPAYVMTGGVSKNPGVVSCLEEKLGCPVKVSEYSQLCGAIGAALIGLTGGR